MKIKNIFVSLILLLCFFTFLLHGKSHAKFDFVDKREIATYAYGAVEKLVIDGIIKGYDDNTFRPFNSITRAEFIKIAIDTMLKYNNNDGKYFINLNDKENDTGFADVNDHWALPYIKFVKAQNIVSGITVDKNIFFKPNDPITRAEACKIVSLIFNIKDTSLILSDDIFENVFKDVGKNDWFYKYVKDLWVHSVISGYGDDKFGPYNFISRQDAATIIIGKSNNDGKLTALSGAVRPVNDEVTISMKIEQAKKISEKNVGKLELKSDEIFDISKWNKYKDVASRYMYFCPDDFKLSTNNDYGGNVSTSECLKLYKESKVSFDDGIVVSFRFVPISVSDTYELSPGKKYSVFLIEQFLSDKENVKHYNNNGFEGFYTMKTNTSTFNLIARKSNLEGYFEVGVIAVGDTKTDLEYKKIVDAIISTFSTF